MEEEEKKIESKEPQNGEEKELLLNEQLDKIAEQIEPKIEKGKKHTKLKYFILAMLLLIIGCVVVIFVLNSLV